MTIPTRPFNPTNWYWIVAGSTTQVYSSASGDYVPVADATYQAWLAKGGNPTKIESEASLGDVMAGYILRPNAPGVLDGYTLAQATRLTVQAVAKVLFNHENRIRTELEGKPALTPAQFLSAIKGLM